MTGLTLWQGHGPVVLDGTALARARAPGLAARSDRLARRLERRPRLALLAFADASGGAPHVRRKARACSAAGVELVPLILPGGTSSLAAQRALGAVLAGEALDGVFLEFPFPPDVDGAALAAMVPEAVDVDIMTAARIEQFFSGRDAPPPLTVSAGLELLEHHDVDIAGRVGVIVGQNDPFTRMFREALARRGAEMQPILLRDAPDLQQRVGGAELFVAAASSPGVIPAVALAPGAVAIDVGYFNPGGRGDIDTSGSIGHLAAIAPVPGGIGPMTVSMLVERVIAFAEQATGP